LKIEPDSNDPLVAQLLDEWGAALSRLGDPLGIDLEEFCRERLVDRLPILVRNLLGGDDVEAAQGVMNALWPHTDPPNQWWATRVGRLVSRSMFGLDGSEAVAIGEAATRLGVSRARAYQLVDAGKLQRHPDGGVTQLSVAARSRALERQRHRTAIAASQARR